MREKNTMNALERQGYDVGILAGRILSNIQSIL
jgi:hypothetical protein